MLQLTALCGLPVRRRARRVVSAWLVAHRVEVWPGVQVEHQVLQHHMRRNAMPAVVLCLARRSGGVLAHGLRQTLSKF